MVIVGEKGRRPRVSRKGGIGPPFIGAILLGPCVSHSSSTSPPRFPIYPETGSQESTGRYRSVPRSGSVGAE